ncbi:MAG: YceI family protein, partial [Longimicrobiales bacterium]
VWTVTNARFALLPDSLVTGLEMRDAFARRSVFETRKYPRLEFAIDSVTAVEPGDTIRAVAHGTMTLRGVSTPHSFPLRGWSEAGGLRIVGHTSFDADDLTEVYRMSKIALGMGVTLGRWDRVYMGIDLVLRRS